MLRTLPVLVVDDTEICRMGTALMLDQLGFSCELAHNGFDAVTLHDKCDTFLHDKYDIQTVSLKLSAAKISVEGGEMHPENIRYGMN